MANENDPMKALVQTGLEESDVDFAPSDKGLDFMVMGGAEDANVHIKVHRFHTERVHSKLVAAPNVIYAHGEHAIQLLARALANIDDGTVYTVSQSVKEMDLPPWDTDDGTTTGITIPGSLKQVTAWQPVKGMRCSECLGPVYHTISGYVCDNGHGGADEDGEPIDPDDKLGASKEAAPVYKVPATARLSVGYIPWGGHTPSSDQTNAFTKAMRWAQDTAADPWFTIRGFPGTGKSTLLAELNHHLSNLVPTAPTNKASKELGNKVGQKCKTTFSALGLRMKHNEEGLVLDYKNAMPDYSRNTVFGVDENSMVGKELDAAIAGVRQRCGFKVLFTGDPAQLPPVGESKSATYKRAKPENTVVLKQVMRFDNQLLALSIKIRKHMADKNWSNPIVDDNDGTEGVFKHTYRDWKSLMLKRNSPSDWIDTKVVAWRNRTVDKYSKLIRESFGFTEEYSVGDRVLLAEPIMEDGNIIGYIDDEYEVVARSIVNRRAGGEKIECYALGLLNSEQDITAFVPTPQGQILLSQVLSNLATKARNSRTGKEVGAWWREFWEIKESFGSLRYAYALTAHRLQGTTLLSAFVDAGDILANKTKRESLQCLMVACTRSTNDIHSF